uniref:Solute carrier family 10 member 1 n=1 Tax=Strix occidentalis caurina TaxID=311401 RepID=A0A8D0FK81_STROC
MNKTKGAFESPELCSPGGMQSTSLTSVAPPFAFIQQAMDKVLNVILIVVLFIIMVSLGCTMEIAKITTHLRKRKGMALAVMAQYGIMPLTAFILAKLFQLGATESLAVSKKKCPSTEGFFLHLSIVMTTCSTVWTNASEGDLEGKVPYKGTVTSLVLMLIPCVISIILNEKKPHYTGFIIKVRSILCWLPFNQGLQWYHGHLLTIPPGIFALMPFIGFLLGYVHSAVFQLDDRCRQTVCMETNCQNIQLCSIILKVTFYSFAPVFLTLSKPNHIRLHVITNELLLSKGRIRLSFNSVTIFNALNTNHIQKSR